MKSFIAILAIVAVASAADVSIARKSVADLKGSTRGVVNPVSRCGGVGTFVQLRISDCDGYCLFRPGNVNLCELDFMPATAATGLIIRVEICLSTGFCLQIINAEIPNSSVQPGFTYTVRYSFAPNDILAGTGPFDFRANLLHLDNDLVEICVSSGAEVVPLSKA